MRIPWRIIAALFYIKLINALCFTSACGAEMENTHELSVTRIYSNSDETLQEFVELNNEPLKLQFTDDILKADVIFNFMEGGTGGGCDPTKCRGFDKASELRGDGRRIEVSVSVKTKFIFDQLYGDSVNQNITSSSARFLIRDNLYISLWVNEDLTFAALECDIFDEFGAQPKAYLISYCVKKYQQDFHKNFYQ